MKPLPRNLDPCATAMLKAAVRDFYNRLEILLTDWRVGVVMYPIAYLICCIVIALVLGDNDIATVEQTLTIYGPLIADWLGKENYHGCPSDSTLLRSLWNAKHTELLIAVSEWGMKWLGMPTGYAIDGKAVKAALEKICGKTHSPFILNGFASNNGCIAAQVKISEKKNELSVVCDLFDMLPMHGALITMDAFATHVKVLREIKRRGAIGLVPVKDNQEGLNTKVTEYFLEVWEKNPEFITWYEDEDNGECKHGRKEDRITGILTKGVPELVKGTRFEGLIEGIAIINRERIVLRHGDAKDLQSEQILMYVYTDRNLTAEQVAKAARGHWSGCEVIHYVLDTEFDEDHSTVHTGNGMENLSCLRKMAYSLLCWIRIQAIEKGLKNIGSFHLIRMMLRDLEGIPEYTNSEYRTLVNKSRKGKKPKAQARAGTRQATAPI